MRLTEPAAYRVFGQKCCGSHSSEYWFSWIEKSNGHWFSKTCVCMRTPRHDATPHHTTPHSMALHRTTHRTPHTAYRTRTYMQTRALSRAWNEWILRKRRSLSVHQYFYCCAAWIVFPMRQPRILQSRCLIGVNFVLRKQFRCVVCCRTGSQHAFWNCKCKHQLIIIVILCAPLSGLDVLHSKTRGKSGG